MHSMEIHAISRLGGTAFEVDGLTLSRGGKNILLSVTKEKNDKKFSALNSQQVYCAQLACNCLAAA